jgi:Uma2 family endonuclease
MQEALDRLPRTMTVAEFLDWPGDGSGRRFQLVNGELRAMSPGSAAHAAIQTNLSYELRRHMIDGQIGGRVLSNPGVITPKRADKNLRIPDLGVTLTSDVPGQKVPPDPIVLIEILSPSNAKDTWDNVQEYTTLPSVREIAVVHSTRVLAEVLRRGADGSWPGETEKVGRADALRLDSIGFACPMQAVYAQTHLA